MDAREEQLRRAVCRYAGSIYGIAYGKLRSAQSSEDVCQEVFLALYESGKVFADEERLKAWLIRVALDKTVDVQRKAYRQREECIEGGGTGVPVLESARYAAEDFHECTDYADVWDIVDELDDDMRTAIHLFYVEGYSTDEIADICGCSAITVRTRLFRARRRIRLRMKEDEGSGIFRPILSDDPA